MRVLTGCKTKYRSRRGFTMAEALLAVAILVILFALLAPNLIRLRKELRQKELDAKAEILYIAVQNQISKLRASGNAALYAGDRATALTQCPEDAEGYNASNEKREFCYLRKGDGKAATAAVMVDALTDAALLDHDWIVEYEPASGTVHAVFYSETANRLGDYPTDWNKYNSTDANTRNLRHREGTRGRLADGARVGYYGGDTETATGGSGTYQLQPTITVNNSETLTLALYCKVPDSDIKVKFTLELTDGTHTRTLTYEVGEGGLSRRKEITLDDLSSSGTRFDALFGSGAAVPESQRLIPGSNLKATLTVKGSGTNAGNLLEGTDSKIFNSLFASYGSSDLGKTAGVRDTVWISCGRHLQNLDAGSGVAAAVTHAVQKDNIDFSKTTGKWLSAYSLAYFNGKQIRSPNSSKLPSFRPIWNPSLTEYDGGGKTIAGLNAGVNGPTEQTKTRSGLFAELPANAALHDIALTGTWTNLAATHSGALVGMVSADCAITNCSVYLMPQDRDSSSFDKLSGKWTHLINGSNAGGLVGTLSDGTLSIRESCAATTLRGSQHAGGLVGSVTGGTLDISRSYADCYIYGARVGGMVGGGTVSSIEDCYVAGFLRGLGTVEVAGIADGSVRTLKNTYTVFDLGPASIPASYATTAAYAGDESWSGVYYLVAGRTARSDPSRQIDMDADALTLLLCADGNEAFQTERPNTLCYNLQDNGLVGKYAYTGLSGLTHYGDWKAEFQTGALVYYEKYKERVGVSYGFYGASVSALREDLPLLGDGYGIVVKDKLAGSVQVTIRNGDQETQTVVAIGGDNCYTVGAEGETYYIYPLDRAIVNAAPRSLDGEGFWWSITLRTLPSGKPQTYSFNPFFAKTQMEEGTATTQVRVRSPRHLYALSRYFASHWSGLRYSFYQERDIDYATYDWAAFSDVADVPTQEPIGTEYGPFSSAYNGGCHTITNISFSTQNGSYVGMFGVAGGYLSNIVLTANADAGRYARRTESLTANQTGCMGILVGRSTGTVDNCAVAGYSLTGASGTIYTYANATLYAGGLVGKNDGTIRNCSVVFPEINLTTLYSEVALGGLVGLNNGTIQNSYALGHLNADARESKTVAAGFAGANTGSISNGCYCGVSVIASGTAESCGFAPGGQVRDSYYLSDGTYYYDADLHSYGSDSETGTRASYKTLTIQSWSASVSADHSIDHYNTQDETVYPFRGAVKNANGAYVHYGDWQTPPKLGTHGVFYWECEEGGSNAGYHFSFLGLDDLGNTKSGATLCTAHDDGGTVTDYGYGYYVLTAETARLTVKQWSGSVAEHADSAWQNRQTLTPLQKARRALEQQMDGYSFYPWLTNVADSGDYLYLTGDAASCTLTLQYNGTPSVYTVSPFFASAMSRSTGAAPGSRSKAFEIRSVRQLQYINWNCVNHDCATKVTSANYQKFPYLQYATVTNKGLQGSEENKKAVFDNRPFRYWKQTHDVNGKNVQGYTPIAAMATSSAFNSYKNILYAWFGGSYDGQSYKIQNLEISSDSFTVGLFGVTVGADLNNIILYGDGTTTIERVTPDASKSNKMTGAYSIGGLIGIAYDYDVKNTTNMISNCAIAGYRIKDSSSNEQGSGTANLGGLIGVANVQLQRCSAVTELIVDCVHHDEAGNYYHGNYGDFIRVGGLCGGALHTVSDCYTGGSIRVTDRSLYELDPSLNTASVKNKRDKAFHIFAAGIASGSYASSFSNFSDSDGSAQPDGTSAVFRNCYTYLQLPDPRGNIRAVSLIVSQGDRYMRATRFTIENCYYLDSVRSNLKCDNYMQYQDGGRLYFDSRGDKTAGRTITEEEFQSMLDGNLLVLSAMMHYQNSGAYTDYKIDTKNDSDPSNDTVELPWLAEPANVDELIASHPSGSTSFEAWRNSGKLRVSWIPNYLQIHGVGFAELSGAGMNAALGPNWGWVTTRAADGNSISGKYSFSDDAAQSGKDYPFPTVIRQGQTISVHYGAWPINGAYWTEGRADADIFEALDASDGWSRKQIMLELRTDHGLDAPLTDWEATGQTEESETFTCEGTRFSFTISPSGMAAVERVEDSGDTRLNVTLRLLRPGAVTVKETTTGASCVVSIGASLQVVAEPALVMLTDAIPTVTCYATAAGKIYTEGRWSVVPETEPEEETEEAAEETEPPEEEADESTARLIVEPDDARIFTVSGSSPGDSFVSVTYTYDYHGTPLEGTTTVPVRTMGFVGLSTGAASHVVRRTAAAQEYTDIPASKLPAAPQGADVFLFTSALEGDLADFRITQIRVNNSEVVFDSLEPVSDPSVTVTFFTENSGTGGGSHPRLETDANGIYSCWGASVRSNTNADQIVSVSVTLTDPVSGQSYTLTVSDVTACAHTVSFHSNAENVSGRMEPVGAKSGAELPVCLYTLTGHTFRAWQDANGETYPDGAALAAVTEDIDLYAQWDANTYTVRFAPGFVGDGEIQEYTFTYGETALPDPTAEDAPFRFEVPTADGYTEFDSWNTAPNWTGKRYRAGAMDLTTEQDGEIELYAQWKKPYTLTLSDRGQSALQQTFTPAAGDAGLPSGEGGYVRPGGPAGWELVGWYNEDGVCILNAEGQITAEARDIEEYTADGKFDLTADAALRSCWSRTAYVMIDKLDAGADDNGFYLVASRKDGQAKLLTNASKIDKNEQFPTATTADVFTAGFCDADGAQHENAYCIVSDADLSAAVWNVTYADPGVLPTANYNHAYKSYWFQNEHDLYLRDEGSGTSRKLQMRVNPKFNTTDYSNRSCWTYGTAAAGMLKDQYAIAQGKDTLTLGLNQPDTASLAWSVKPGLTCFLFRQQTIFSYDPDGFGA